MKIAVILVLLSALVLTLSCGYPMVPLDYMIEEQEAVSHMTLVKEVRITDIGALASPWTQGIEVANNPLIFPDPKTPSTKAFLLIALGDDNYDAVKSLTRVHSPGIYILSLDMDSAVTSITYQSKALNDANLDLRYLNTPSYDSRSEFLRLFPIGSAGPTALGIVGPTRFNPGTITLRVVEHATNTLLSNWNDSLPTTSGNPPQIVEQTLDGLLSADATVNAVISGPVTYGAYPKPPVPLSDGSVRYGDLALLVQQSSPVNAYTVDMTVNPVSTVIGGTFVAPRLLPPTSLGGSSYGFFAVDPLNDRWFASPYSPLSSQYARLSWIGVTGTSVTQSGSWPIVRALGDGSVMRLDSHTWAPLSFDSQGLPTTAENPRYKTGSLTFLYEYQKDGDMYLMFDQTLSVPTPGYQSLVMRAWTIKRSDFLALQR